MILRESVLRQPEAGVAFVQGGGSPAEAEIEDEGLSST